MSTLQTRHPRAMPGAEPPTSQDRVLDLNFLLHNNGVGFTQSARRHRIGRARVRHVLAHADAVVLDEGPPLRLLVVGDDHTGRSLELVAVWDFPRLWVIHAMDTRPVVRRRYEEGTRYGEGS